jgi:O2-independent ubiquinone biosynthesis protein UbiV
MTDNATSEAGRITLGPVLFNWPADIWRDFYFRMADEAPVDRVVLGEVVCSKRTPFTAGSLPDVIDRLQSAGKEVVLASPALVANERDRRATQELAEETDHTIEANDGFTRIFGAQVMRERLSSFSLAFLCGGEHPLP